MPRNTFTNTISIPLKTFLDLLKMKTKFGQPTLKSMAFRDWDLRSRNRKSKTLASFKINRCSQARWITMSPFIYVEDLLENSHGSLETLDNFTTFLYILVCFYSNTPLKKVLDSSKENNLWRKSLSCIGY